MFAMSGDGTDDVSIPALFLFNKEGKKLLLAYQKQPELEVYMGFKAKTLGERASCLCKEIFVHYSPTVFPSV